MWNCGYFAKWRNEGVVTNASRLTATAVATDTRRHLPEIAWKAHCRRQEIAGIDQTTIRVERNFTRIVQFFEIYIYAIATDAPRLIAKRLNLPEIAPTSCCRRQKHRQQWPGNHKQGWKWDGMRWYGMILAFPNKLVTIPAKRILSEHTGMAYLHFENSYKWQNNNLKLSHIISYTEYKVQTHFSIKFKLQMSVSLRQPSTWCHYDRLCRMLPTHHNSAYSGYMVNPLSLVPIAWQFINSTERQRRSESKLKRRICEEWLRRRKLRVREMILE